MSFGPDEETPQATTPWPLSTVCRCAFARFDSVLLGRGASVLSYPLTQTDMANSRNQLHQNCLSIAKELECASDASTSGFLDRCLDYEFTVSAQRQFLGARILVAFGGPNIWVDTRFDRVEGYWGGDSIEMHFEDVNDLHGICEELFDASL